VGLLCRIYCLWIVMMAHKSKKKNFSSLSSSGLICVFHSFFSLGKVFLVVIVRWCSFWKFTPSSYSPSFIIYIYINVYAYVHQSHLIAHSFCFYWRELHDASLCPIDDEVLLSFIHKWSVCVTKQRRRDRESHQKMWWYAS